jgi:hypothetical protein
MIIHRILAIAALAAAARAECNVTVYMNVETDTRGAVVRARQMAAEAFAAAGVRIEWRRGQPSRAQMRDNSAIAIWLAERSDPAFRPGVLARTELGEGVRITVFWDRIAGRERPALKSVVLAHVLVHELTHGLQGVDWHAESGIMKAQWTPQDYRAMSRKTLPFTPHDLELIQLGLARRPGLASQNISYNPKKAEYRP